MEAKPPDSPGLGEMVFVQGEGKWRMERRKDISYSQNTHRAWGNGSVSDMNSTQAGGPEFDHQNPSKTALYEDLIIELWGWDWPITGACWSASLAELVSSRFTETPRLKNTRLTDWWLLWALPSDFYMLTHARVSTRGCTHRHTKSKAPRRQFFTANQSLSTCI